MNTIGLYQLFRRIPDATDDEAKAAVASIPQVGQVNEMATKADLHRLEIKLTNLETRLTRLIFGVAFSTTVVIIGAVGLMIKFIPST